MKEVYARRYSSWSWVALGIGLMCFIFVFGGPLRISAVGYAEGDLFVALLTVAGLSLSIVGLTRRSEKKGVLWVSLVLSLSLPLFWTFILAGLITGLIPLAP
ncbi:hypothetical protein P4H66_15020 [Paenibacillus dokdonensis]|uniref:Uncharacterized protein n=1 Tax=Paenibacillus dokdonensis TaxID=2567944 RepID=A0ABU6GSL4_9BACL|nr:hypothetical protein [Paenibacillus dokdonensis]MEC0241162.1 hypothetical protein [Paenibacillus dokdonensis]